MMVRLQVIVNALNKRSFIPAQFPEPQGIQGVVFEGFSFIGEQATTDQVPNPLLGKWYKDRDGYYYWGGGLLIIDEMISPLIVEAPTEELTTAFGWFTDLGVEKIWNQFNEQGEAATIAVLDTGYDLKNDDLKSAVVGVNRFDVPVAIHVQDVTAAQMHDTNGHGTFCASILANRNNKGLNIGVAPKSKLLVGKISESGGLPADKGLDIILNGIEWAIQNGADIISISFGKFQSDLPPSVDLQKLQARFTSLVTGKEVLIFASSGDNPPGTILTRERYPASFNGCVSVGASNQQAMSAVTVLSSKTIIHAQGEKVEAYGKDSKIETKTGTSMSTPMVAAIAAMAVSLEKKKNNGVWNAHQLLNKLYETGSPIPGGNKKIIDPLAFFNQL